MNLPRGKQRGIFIKKSAQSGFLREKWHQGIVESIIDSDFYQQQEIINSGIISSIQASF